MAKPILLYNPIFSYTAEQYTDRLLSLDDDKESLTWINSPGGSVFAGWSMIGALKDRAGANYAKVMGNASSMAFYLTLFMDKVEALEVSTFLIHRADGYVQSDDDKEFLNKINAQLRQKFEERINPETFNEVTGVSFDEIFSMEGRKDVIITAKQAKKIGLVDKIVRLETKQIEALTNEFMALGDFNEQGSELDSQGSVIPVDEPINNNNQISEKMDLQKLKAEHPEIVDQIVSEERDRVNAYLTYVDVDAEAVKKGIESGENPTQTFYAEMNRKGMAIMANSQAEEDSPESVTTTVEPTAQTEQESELAKLEAEARASAKIEGKEAE